AGMGNNRERTTEGARFQNGPVSNSCVVAEMETALQGVASRTGFCAYRWMDPRSSKGARLVPVATAPGSDLPPIAPIPISHRPPIGTNRLTVGWFVWLGQIHLFRIFLKAFDLVGRIKQEGYLVVVGSDIDVLLKPASQNFKSILGNRSHLVRRALIRSQRHQLIQHHRI